MAPPPYLLRRILLPLILAAEAALLALLCATAVVGLVTFPLDRRLRACRLAVMGVAYIALEWAALILLLGVWLGRPFGGRRRYDRANVAVVGWALGLVLGSARRTVGLRICVDQVREPGALGEPGPVLVLARHGGIGDSFALVWLLTARYRRRPRVVLRQVLLWEPLIDVALSRVGACFLPPAAGGERLEDRVAGLAAGLEAGDALLLFPEGANWTPHRRLRAIGRLWASRRPAAARAASLMDHVLPPRTGGVLACLEVRPDVPVVVVAHTGLDKIVSAGQLWASVPFDRPMEIRSWPPACPPADPADRIEWLTTEWAVIDQWIDSRHSAAEDQRAGSRNFSKRHHSSPS